MNNLLVEAHEESYHSDNPVQSLPSRHNEGVAWPLSYMSGVR